MSTLREYEGCSVFFFFSSRRRHTRLQGDWSSDVCSSDLCHCRGSKLPVAVQPRQEHVHPQEGEGRSEEHTSELQSPCNLVCRLLLEKKKNIMPPMYHTMQPWFYHHNAVVTTRPILHSEPYAM